MCEGVVFLSYNKISLITLKKGFVMKILGKAGILLFVFVVGAILAGVAKSYYGSGNFIILGVTAAILLYIWNK